MQTVGDKFHAIFIPDHDVLRMEISANAQFSTDYELCHCPRDHTQPDDIQDERHILSLKETAQFFL